MVKYVHIQYKFQMKISKTYIPFTAVQSFIQ